KNLKNDKCLPLPVEFQNLDWFHHHGDIDRWDDYDATPCHTLTGDFRQLDDFKTELPEVREAMSRIYKWWIGTTDIDGFRVDTVKHVEMGFWQVFCPAIHSYATSIGKKNFFMFGEAWICEDRKLAAYSGTKGGGKFLFDGMLGFPLWKAASEV